MALDTKQLQGSAIDLGSPWRQWLAEPTLTPGFGEQQSLLKLCANPLTVESEEVSTNSVHVTDWPIIQPRVETPEEFTRPVRWSLRSRRYESEVTYELPIVDEPPALELEQIAPFVFEVETVPTYVAELPALATRVEQPARVPGIVLSVSLDMPFTTRQRKTVAWRPHFVHNDDAEALAILMGSM